MVSRRIIWSPQAKIDHFNILNYFFKRNGNKKYSSKLNKEFHDAIRIISKYSDVGVKTDVKNVRCIIVSNYSIFYRIENTLIEIITIWDSRQNPANLEI